MALCDRCSVFRFERVTASTAKSWRQKTAESRLGPGIGDTVYEQSPSFTLLKDSATHTGCPFCRMLLYALQYLTYNYSVVGACKALQPWEPDGPDSAAVVVLWQADRLLFLCGPKYQLLSSMPSLRDVFLPFSGTRLDPADMSTGSRASQQLARTWIQTCLDEHPLCRSYCRGSTQRGLPLLPTRVLDVGGPGSSPAADPSLLVVASGQRADYVALSHCWGSTPQAIPQTTRANLAQRQVSIPLASLPPNFRDAVALTCSLGFRYLWIDSLCIVQDSPSDWDVESGRMQLVYRHAFVTIAAVQSAGPDDGIFTGRDAAEHRPIRLALALPAETSPSPSFWRYANFTVPDGPLYSRAWVFQEQALAGRTLAYCEEKLSWACVSTILSEEILQQQEGLDIRNVFRRFKECIVASETQSCADDGDRAVLHDLWNTIVHEYSMRSITYASDKLPAVSGLAEPIGRLLGDEYLAGLWRRDLVHGLQWSHTGSQSLRRRRRIRPPEAYVAPSWSWASVMGGLVEFADENGGDDEPSTERVTRSTDDIEIVDARCRLRGSSRYGQIVDGTIELRGFVKLAVLRRDNDLCDALPPSREPIGRIEFDADEDSDAVEGREILCLYMNTVLYESMSDCSSEFTSPGIYLALVPTGLTDHEYRRVGAAKLDRVQWDGTEKRRLVLV